MSADPEFEKLVELYYRDLYRFGLSLTRSEADACDLTQEVFYIWAKKGHQLKDPTSVKRWLFRTLHREFLQICRRADRFSREPINEAAQDLPHVSAEVVNRMDAQTLLEALDQIDEDYRAPLVLYYIDDLSYKEIGDILEIPLGTVQSRIARAKIKLFQLLTETALDLWKVNEYEPSQRDVVALSWAD
jgi:RNA polymerase sigma-70 factor (ECF subfamily)